MMSLISYSTRDNREIVLRHKDAIVLRDPQTHQLILRGAKSSTHCPTCHQLIQGSSSERQESPHRSTPFISSEYFRLLQSLNERSVENDTPLSPVLRLVEPDFESFSHSTGSSASVSENYDEMHDRKSGSSIRKEAFSQSYFKKFFIEEKVLGRGGKGVVLLVRHELDGVSLGQFACKRVPVGDNHAWLEKVLVEVQLLQGLSHPNLVSYRHVWLENVRLNRFGPSVPCAFILQQYCNEGDLLHYVVGALPKVKNSKERMKEQIRKSRNQAQLEGPEFESCNRGLALEEIYSFFKDIVSGLAHLHGSNYIHRDLKPSNCLLHKEGKEIKCLISDFGEVQVENMARKSTGSTGTISYCAPEVLKQDSSGRFGNFTTKSDIFSLGMILYFMCFRRLPYKSADSVEEENEDINLLRAEINAWSGFSDEKRERPDLPNRLYDLLKKLLAIDPDERPGTTEILTAIRTDKGFGNPARPRRASNASRIIKSLDSSVPLAVPTNVSTDRALRMTDTGDDSFSSSELQELEEDLRLIVKSTDVAPRSLSHNYQPISSPRSLQKTPLLMPPPSTLLSAVQNNVSLCRHRTYRWLGHVSQVPDMRIKFVLFMVKLWSLTTPCKSGLARPLVWWPLVSFGALELSIGTKGGWTLIIWMNLLHFSILAVLWLWCGGLSRGLCSWESDFWT